MKDKHARYEITYRLVSDTPLIMRNLEGKTSSNVEIPFISGHSLQAVARNQYRAKHDVPFESANEDRTRVEKLLFGSTDGVSKMIFTDFVPANGQKVEPELHISTEIRITNSNSPNRVRTQTVIPAKTELLGKVIFDNEPNGIERSIGLSTILDIPSWGGNRTRGYGKWTVEIIKRSSLIVFISYSWEDKALKNWVQELALRLIDGGIDVLLDQFAPSFTLAAKQEEINDWMMQSVNNCDKVIAILTPQYKYKAENSLGGVGYEYSKLCAERGQISNKLNRYIGVLRKGSYAKSLPELLKNRPVFDMRNSQIGNAAFSELVQELFS
jgi:hypothetical protein